MQSKPATPTLSQLCSPTTNMQRTLTILNSWFRKDGEIPLLAIVQLIAKYRGILDDLMTIIHDPSASDIRVFSVNIAARTHTLVFGRHVPGIINPIESPFIHKQPHFEHALLVHHQSRLCKSMTLVDLTSNKILGQITFGNSSFVSPRVVFISDDTVAVIEDGHLKTWNVFSSTLEKVDYQSNVFEVSLETVMFFEEETNTLYFFDAMIDVRDDQIVCGCLDLSTLEYREYTRFTQVELYGTPVKIPKEHFAYYWPQCQLEKELIGTIGHFSGVTSFTSTNMRSFPPRWCDGHSSTGLELKSPSERLSSNCGIFLHVDTDNKLEIGAISSSNKDVSVVHVFHVPDGIQSLLLNGLDVREDEKTAVTLPLEIGQICWV